MNDELPPAAGGIIQRVAEAPDGSRRPSGVFVAIVALLLGGAMILGGKVIGTIVLLIGLFAIGSWIVLMWLSRDARQIVALCENGIVVWSRADPQELVPWDRLRSLAYTTTHVRYLGTIKALLLDFGRTEAVVLPEEEQLPLIARIVELAHLRPITLEPNDPRFPFGVFLAWGQEDVDRRV
jgi:hypothetical protein